MAAFRSPSQDRKVRAIGASQPEGWRIAEAQYGQSGARLVAVLRHRAATYLLPSRGMGGFLVLKSVSMTT